MKSGSRRLRKRSIDQSTTPSRSRKDGVKRTRQPTSCSESSPRSRLKRRRKSDISVTEADSPVEGTVADRIPDLTAYVTLANECTKCDISDFCTNKVTHRNSAELKVPVDVLFVGEAPGLTEYTLEEPFVGPSGEVLENLIS